jgi:multidrug efflux pump subunit AcrA (membrane-fusion protein)
MALLKFALSGSAVNAADMARLRTDRQHVCRATPPEVTVCLPLQQAVPDSLDLTGTTTAIESVEVRARVQGFLERIAFKDGARVKAGDLLFEIDPRPYQADYDRDNANLAQAKARLERTEADFARAKELLPKNAIARSDYDVALGKSVREAAIEAARLRLRPILMTSMVFCLGVVPLAIASGAGAVSRQALGTAVLGGMLGATILGVVFTPVLYVILQGRKASPD